MARRSVLITTGLAGYGFFGVFVQDSDGIGGDDLAFSDWLGMALILIRCGQRKYKF